MVHDLMPVILIGAVAFGALRLFAGKRNEAPMATSRRAANQAIGKSVHRARRPARPPQVVTVATEDIRSITPGKSYLLGNARLGGRSDATTALLDIMSGPGLCTPRTEDPS